MAAKQEARIHTVIIRLRFGSYTLKLAECLRKKFVRIAQEF